MARQEEDREDLLREATALVERVELQVGEEAIVVGFRRNGNASLFVDADLVFQFDSQQRLRRGFHSGRLLVADRGRLVSLTRERSRQEVSLVRHELADAEAEAFLGLAHEQLAALGAALCEGEAAVVGQIPPDANVAGRVKEWLAKLPRRLEIADRPNVG